MSRLPTLGPRGEGWVALQLVLIGVVAVLGALRLPATLANLPSGWPLLIQGAVLLSAGGWLVLRGLRDLGPSLTALPRPHPEATLVESGVYGRLRHPIYAGVIALGIGWALVSASLPALVGGAALAVVLDLKARREEQWLEERYERYGAYRDRTHRFVPRVY